MKRTRAFVDRIEDATAVLVIDSRCVNWPAALLPDGAREGAWVEIAIETIDPPAGAKEAEELRRRLAEGDDGDDFKL